MIYALRMRNEYVQRFQATFTTEQIPANRIVDRDLQEWPLPTGEADGWQMLITVAAIVALAVFVFLIEQLTNRRAVPKPPTALPAPSITADETEPSAPEKIDAEVH